MAFVFSLLFCILILRLWSTMTQKFMPKFLVYFSAHVCHSKFVSSQCSDSQRSLSLLLPPSGSLRFCWPLRPLQLDPTLLNNELLKFREAQGFLEPCFDEAIFCDTIKNSHSVFKITSNPRRSKFHQHVIEFIAEQHPNLYNYTVKKRTFLKR